MTTMTRSFSVLASVLLSLASTAHAARPAVGSPFVMGECKFPTEVTQGMADPHGWFSAAPHCLALCRKALGQCEQLVKSSFNCQIQWLNLTFGYDRKQCEVEFAGNGAMIQSCKSERTSVQQSQRSDIVEGRDEAITACEDWDTTCERTCDER